MTRYIDMLIARGIRRAVLRRPLIACIGDRRRSAFDRGTLETMPMCPMVATVRRTIATVLGLALAGCGGTAVSRASCPAGDTCIDADAAIVDATADTQDTSTQPTCPPGYTCIPDDAGPTGSSDATSPSDAAAEEATTDATDTDTSMGEAGVDAGPGWQDIDASATVDTLTDGGLPSVECIGVVTRDLVVDPTRPVLYASLSASSPLFGNSVVRIDPSNVAVTGTVFVGSNPNALATTDDGASLYVGDDGTASVCRVDLASGGVYDSVSLGLGQYSNAMLVAGEIRAVPGSATQWVVIRNGPYDPAFDSLALYDGTTMLAKWATLGADVGSIAFISPTILYGYDNENTGWDLYELSVGSTGFMQASVTGIITGWYDITSQGGWVFATNGQAVYGATAQPAGQYPATGSVWPDPNGTDVWILQVSGATTTLFDFDRTTFVAKRSFVLPVAGAPTTLVGWSSTGLAFRTAGSVCIVNVP